MKRARRCVAGLGLLGFWWLASTGLAAPPEMQVFVALADNATQGIVECANQKITVKAARGVFCVD